MRKYNRSMRSKLNASLSCSKNMAMVSPSSWCRGSLANIWRAATLLHSTTCNVVDNSGRLKKSCATSSALPTNFSSISSPLRLASIANLRNAFFTRSIWAKGDGMAVRGCTESPPLGSSIMLISSALYWLVRAIHPSPDVFLLYESILLMTYTKPLYFSSTRPSSASSSREKKRNAVSFIWNRPALAAACDPLLSALSNVL